MGGGGAWKEARRRTHGSVQVRTARPLGEGWADLSQGHSRAACLRCTWRSAGLRKPLGGSCPKDMGSLRRVRLREQRQGR